MTSEYTQDDLKLHAKLIANTLHKQHHHSNIFISEWFLRVHNNGCQLVIPYTLKGETAEQQYTEAL
jgi:hypothetical protein